MKIEDIIIIIIVFCYFHDPSDEDTKHKIRRTKSYQSTVTEPLNTKQVKKKLPCFFSFRFHFIDISPKTYMKITECNLRRCEIIIIKQLYE